MITEAFKWSDTKEGQHYWGDLHYKWMDYIHTYIKG